jgi:hypothetical protein
VGDEVLIERRYSGTLLLALLKAHRPGKFRDDSIAEKLTDYRLTDSLPRLHAAGAQKAFLARNGRRE